MPQTFYPELFAAVDLFDLSRIIAVFWEFALDSGFFAMCYLIYVEGVEVQWPYRRPAVVVYMCL